MIRSIPVCLVALFISGRITAVEFANPYVHIWYYEASDPECRDEGLLMDFLSQVFILADSYSDDPTVEFGELNEDQLRQEIIDLNESMGIFKLTTTGFEILKVSD